MLEIKKLHFSYGDHCVFKEFSFSLKQNESLCIKGKNGTGKTTLLKILCGLNYAPQLKCTIDGIDYSQNDLKKRVIYIPSSPNFYESLSLKEYVAWIKAMWKKEESFYSSVQKNLQALHLCVDEDKEISTYSLGMKYKLYFATFLALEYPILLLDEPFNSLDKDSRSAAISLINEHIKRHQGYCIFSSHVEDTIIQLSTKVLHI
ncbi:MAG: ATP-binding cassette domain-containing protein [Breznakia sp.]